VTEPEQGPYRDDARPSTLPAPWSTPAVASLPTVVLGWILVLAASDFGVGALYVGGLVLLVGTVLAAAGISETSAPPEVVRDPAEPASPPPVIPRGRPVAKLALGVFLTPIVLGCIGLGLLFLACGGH